MSKPFYALCGALVSGFVGVVISLVAAGIQQRALADQFSEMTLWILIGLALLGLIIGAWLGEKLTLHPSSSHRTQAARPESPDTVTLTRLRAFLSYSKLKGKGIHLQDIMLFGSRIDIET